MVRTTQLFIVHYLLRRDRVHMEKVVVSLGGSVLVPGDDDARYLHDLVALFRDVSTRVKLFIVTGGGRIARYYIETGESSASANGHSTSSASRSRASTHDCSPRP